MQALSLDMGGSHIGCAVVRDGTLLAESSINSEGAQSLASLLPAIKQTLEDLLQRAQTSASQCAGVAIGFPGIVDFRTGAIYSTLKKYEDAQQMDLMAWARESFGLTLRLENDARMALLGEHFAGAAQDTENVIMMTLGTGIGGAAMMHGHLLRGVHAQAGCLGGHLPVDFHGRTCLCGNIGCAEAEAAGWSMPLVARAWPGFAASSLADVPQLGFRQLFEHAEKGDSVAAAVRDRCLEVWASNAVANIHAYDPEVVVMGGGVMRSAAVILPYVQEYVNKHAWAGWGKPQVRAAKLGPEAGLLGAVPLLKEQVHAAAI